MKGLIIAIQFLTRLPTPRLAVSSAEFAASMRWFPWISIAAMRPGACAEEGSASASAATTRRRMRSLDNESTPDLGAVEGAAH